MIDGILRTNLIVLVLISCSACSSHRVSNTASTTVEPQSTVLEVLNQPLPGQPLIAEPAAELSEHTAIEYMRIKHHQTECEGFEPGHCFVAMMEGSDEWVYLYESIEGFDYQWGVEYEILVQAQEIDSGLTDALNLRYTLLEVLSEKEHEADEAFQYVSRKPQDRIVEITPGQFSLLNNKTFNCTDDACDALRSAIDQNQATLLSFRHSDDPALPLVLDAVLCSDAVTSFPTTCL